MSLATSLLRAEPIGVKELKNRLSAVLKRHQLRLVTDRNKPRHFLVPYDDLVELAEMLEELSHPKLLQDIAAGRQSYRKGHGVALEDLAKDLKLKP